MKSKKPDYVLIYVVVLLILLGIIILGGAAAPLSEKLYHNPYHILFHQIFFALLPGIFLGIIIYYLPLPFLKRSALPLILFSLFLMILVFFPGIGLAKGGAKRWLNLRFASFQPSEFLKLTFILYLSAWLDKIEKKRANSKAFLPFLVILGITSFLLVLQPDISTLGVIAIIAIILYFIAKTPLSHIIILGVGGVLSLLLLIKLAPYRLNRFFIFLHPEADPLGLGYQIKQSLIAIGSGGIFGRGLGLSEQKFGFLPQSFSDSIFPIFAEDTGFIGSLLLLTLFLIFSIRGFKIAKETTGFQKYLACGITSWILIQTFVNIGAMIGILPLTGIPLPFISYGGTALLVELMGVAILLNLSKNI